MTDQASATSESTRKAAGRQTRHQLLAGGTRAVVADHAAGATAVRGIGGEFGMIGTAKPRNPDRSGSGQLR